ncbi:MAG: uncharacterized protein QOG87_1364 [Actinomycetota bacterium]|jgi:predicted CoA-binding protein
MERRQQGYAFTMANDRDTIRRIAEESKTWAVVGLSPDRSRASNGVAQFLLARGYRVIPVNPQAGCDEILGQRCYPDLASIEEPVDVVDVFRRSEQAGVHVDEAIAIGAKAVWLQLGVIDERAAARAREAGLDVVMDRCPKIEFPGLSLRRTG